MKKILAVFIILISFSLASSNNDKMFQELKKVYGDNIIYYGNNGGLMFSDEVAALKNYLTEDTEFITLTGKKVQIKSGDIIKFQSGFYFYKIPEKKFLLRSKNIEKDIPHWFHIIHIDNGSMVNIVIFSSFENVGNTLSRKGLYFIFHEGYICGIQYGDAPFSFPIIKTGNIRSDIAHFFYPIPVSIEQLGLLLEKEDEKAFSPKDVHDIYRKVRSRFQGAYLGVSLMLQEKDVIIEKVFDDSPAMYSELKAGDILLSVDGKKVKSITGFVEYIKSKNPQDEINIQIKRKNKKMTFKVILGSRSQFIPSSKIEDHRKRIQEKLENILERTKEN